MDHIPCGVLKILANQAPSSVLCGQMRATTKARYNQEVLDYHIDECVE